MSIRLFCAASLIACSAITLLAVDPSTLAAAPNPQPFDHPLVFEPNHGQAPAQVQWIARGSGYQLLFTNEGITMLLRDRAREAPPSSLIPALFQAPRLSADRTKATYSTMKMKLNGGRPWRSVAGLEPTGGTSNYFIGDDPLDNLSWSPRNHAESLGRFSVQAYAGIESTRIHYVSGRGD